jgi:hypothetical protein
MTKLDAEDDLVSIINDLQRKAIDDTITAIRTTVELANEIAGGGGVMSVSAASIEAGMINAADAWQFLVDGTRGKPGDDARLVIALMAARYGFKPTETGALTFDILIEIGRQFRAVTGREMIVPGEYRYRR